MKKILFFGVLSLVGLSFSACQHTHDYNYDNVTPPTVAVAANTLTGVITDIQGNPISGATVKVGSMTATTDNDGVYHFDNVPAGSYTITASAPGKVNVTTDLVVSNSGNTQKLIWNASLPKENTTEFNVTVNGGGHGEVESEALRFNDQGKVEINVQVANNNVPKDVKIYLTPIYTEAGAELSRAEEEAMLIGANLSCSDPNLKLSQDVAITFDLDNSVANVLTTKKYVNGHWVEVEHAVTDGNVVINDRDFTFYGLFLQVDIAKKVKTEAIVFEKSEWNNLYGAHEEYVDVANFNYKAGTEIISRASNKLEGLLIEYMARLFGCVVKTVPGTYPIETVLPVGTALSIKGAQEITDITITGNSRSVKGTAYGTTTVQVTTYNRNHNGGGSSPVGQ